MYYTYYSVHNLIVPNVFLQYGRSEKGAGDIEVQIWQIFTCMYVYPTETAQAENSRLLEIARHIEVMDQSNL